MKTVRTVLIVGASLLIACPWLSGADKCKDPPKAKKAPPCPAAQRVDRMTEGLTLTDDQKAKLGELKKEFGPKLMEAMKKMDVLTPDQKKARNEAVKAAAAAGKDKKEAWKAGEAAVTLTDDQKAKLEEGKKVIAPLEKELREKAIAVLTPEQQEQVKKKMHHGKKAK